MAAYVELVSASPQDAARIASLHAASWRASYRGQLPDAFLDAGAAAERLATWEARMRGAEGPLEATLALVGGELAGFACLMPLAEPEHGVYLDNLHVLPAFHGHGLGKRLLAHCAQRAQALAPGQPLFLYVLEGNALARAFYRRMGGIESAPFDDAFAPAGVVVTVRRVVWPDVPALAARCSGA
ncbi:GNAT family N-acetyltransferase [Cupriavidus respiraculi]|uniref:GNAT family N-acetyltransferase n=1 Tax=Cupriavidus respiraculi TaxID=195930 RepID=UPI001C954AEA|nr:GNAT family N-acetyltransferase [Cupriavidus respiraculi]MBY4949137.1 GNAT family N-acetyltransferase [Cupriavidus respiraculi]